MKNPKILLPLPVVEIIDTLKKLGEKMNKQDNRMAQYPLFIVVQDEREYGVYGGEGRERITLDEIDEDKLCPVCLKKFHDGEDLPSTCDYCDDSLFVNYRVKKHVPQLQAGVFFTAEACQKHIEENRHHYNDTVRTYGIANSRNPEMQSVLKAISTLGASGEKIPSFYD